MLIKSRFDGVLKSLNKMLTQLDDIVNQTNSEISLAEATIKEANIKKDAALEDKSRAERVRQRLEDLLQ